MDSLRRLMDLVEAAQKPAAADYDIQAKYDDFNAKYFEGKLPRIPVEFAPLKGVGGVVKYRLTYSGPVKIVNGKRMKAVPRASVHKHQTLVPGSLVLQLSNLFKRDPKDLDGILLHEMIHVYFVAQGEFGENHGYRFMRELRRLTAESGIKVPRKDDLEDAELSDEIPVKAVGVLLVEKTEGGHIFALISPSVAHSVAAEQKARWEYNLKIMHRTYKEARLMIIATPLWTNVASRHKIGRKKLGFLRLPEGEYYDDLMKNGRVLWDIKSPPNAASS
jgi:hypothetical protein